MLGIVFFFFSEFLRTLTFVCVPVCAHVFVCAQNFEKCSLQNFHYFLLFEVDQPVKFSAPPCIYACRGTMVLTRAISWYKGIIA